MANNRAQINTTLQVCGFTVQAHRNFLLTSESLDTWASFEAIEYDDFASISKNATRHTPPFSLGVLKQKRLSALKFWIEDKARMNKVPVAANFTARVLAEYIELYDAYVKAKVSSVEFVNGPQFDADNWVVFETGTEECLSDIQSHNGVPLSYILRDDTRRPPLTILSDRDTKLFWHAPLTGTAFTHDNKRVWTYLVARCNNTPAWSHIKMFQRPKNGRSAWMALSLFYGGTAEMARKMLFARAALATLTWSNESSFKFSDYATQLVDHFETLDRGGQPKTDEEKVIKLLGGMNTNDNSLITRMEMNRTNVTFAAAIVNISTSIGQLYPLANVKGRKAIVSQVGSDDATSYSTHCNGILFTEQNWNKHMNNDDYKRIPTQMRRLIGFAKANNFTDKQAAFNENKKQNRANKRGVSQVSNIKEDDIVERAISKVAKYYQDKIAENGAMVPYAPEVKEETQSNSNAGSTFGKQNATGGSR